MLENEIKKGAVTCLQHIPGTNQILIQPDRSFTFDYVFNKQDTQNDLYENSVKPLINQFLSGYNTTVMAYGQTGSGKTYTMGTSAVSANLGAENDEAGLIPRAFADIYSYLNERKDTNDNFFYQVEASFIELYNDDINDLLQPGILPEKSFEKNKFNSFLKKEERSKKNSLIRSSSISDMIFKNDKSGTENQLWSRIHKVIATDDSDLYRYLDKGNLNRKIGSTQMNEFSSRSHAIFTLTLTQQSLKPADNTTLSPKSITTSQLSKIVSKIHFVDLAGSERIKDTRSTGKRMQEGISINSGLLALGNVISSLGNAIKRQLHIPYRNSKLTRLLEDSLGGNSLTLMIACVTETKANYNENLSTLRYANRARNIKNKIVISEQKVGNSEIVCLKMQIQQLKAQLDNQKNQQSQKNSTINTKSTLQQHIGTITKNEIKQTQIENERRKKSASNSYNINSNIQSQILQNNETNTQNATEPNIFLLTQKVEVQSKEIAKLENLLKAKYFIKNKIISGQNDSEGSRQSFNDVESTYVKSFENKIDNSNLNSNQNMEQPSIHSKHSSIYNSSKLSSNISSLSTVTELQKLDSKKKSEEFNHKKNSPIVTSLRSFKTFSRYFSKNNDDKIFKNSTNLNDQKNVKDLSDLKSLNSKKSLNVTNVNVLTENLYEQFDNKWTEISNILSSQKKDYLSSNKKFEEVIKNQKKQISNLKKLVEIKTQYENRASKYSSNAEIQSNDRENLNGRNPSTRFKRSTTSSEEIKKTDMDKSKSFKTLLDNYIELCVKASTYYSELDIFMKRQNDLIEYQGSLFSKLETLENLETSPSLNNQVDASNSSNVNDTIGLKTSSLNSKVILIDAELRYLDARIKLIEQNLADIAIYFKGKTSFDLNSSSVSQIALVENIDKIQFSDFSSITNQLDKDELQYMAFLLCQNILDMKIDLSKVNQNDKMLKTQNFTLQNQIDVIRRVSISVATMYESEILELETQSFINNKIDSNCTSLGESLNEPVINHFDKNEKITRSNSLHIMEDKSLNTTCNSGDSETSGYTSLLTNVRESSLESSAQASLDLNLTTSSSSKAMVSELDLTIPFFETLSNKNSNNTNKSISKKIISTDPDCDNNIKENYRNSSVITDPISFENSNSHKIIHTKSYSDLKCEKKSDNSKKAASLGKKGKSINRRMSCIQIPALMNGGQSNTMRLKNKKTNSFVSKNDNSYDIDYLDNNSIKAYSHISTSKTNYSKHFSLPTEFFTPPIKPNSQPNQNTVYKDIENHYDQNVSVSHTDGSNGDESRNKDIILTQNHHKINTIKILEKDSKIFKNVNECLHNSNNAFTQSSDLKSLQRYSIKSIAGKSDRDSDISYNNINQATRFSLDSAAKETLETGNYHRLSSGIASPLSHNPPMELVQRVKKRGILQSALKMANLANPNNNKTTSNQILSSSTLFLSDTNSNKRSSLDQFCDNSLNGSKTIGYDFYNGGSFRYGFSNLTPSINNSVDTFKRGNSMDNYNNFSILDSRESLSIYGNSRTFSAKDRELNAKNHKAFEKPVNDRNKVQNDSDSFLGNNLQYLKNSRLKSYFLSTRNLTNSASDILKHTDDSLHQKKTSLISKSHRRDEMLKTKSKLLEYDKKLQSYSDIYRESKEQLDSVYKTIGTNKKSLQENGKTKDNFYLMMEVLKNNSSSEDICKKQGTLENGEQFENSENFLSSLNFKTSTQNLEKSSSPNTSNKLKFIKNPILNSSIKPLESKESESSGDFAAVLKTVTTLKNTKSFKFVPSTSIKNNSESNTLDIVSDKKNSIISSEKFKIQDGKHIIKDKGMLTISKKINNSSIEPNSRNKPPSLQNVVTYNLITCNNNEYLEKSPSKLCSSKIIDKITNLEKKFSLSSFSTRSLPKLLEKKSKASLNSNKSTSFFDFDKKTSEYILNSSSFRAKNIKTKSASMPDLSKLSSSFCKTNALSIQKDHLLNTDLKLSLSSFSQIDRGASITKKTLKGENSDKIFNANPNKNALKKPINDSKISLTEENHMVASSIKKPSFTKLPKSKSSIGKTKSSETQSVKANTLKNTKRDSKNSKNDHSNKNIKSDIKPNESKNNHSNKNIKGDSKNSKNDHINKNIKSDIKPNESKNDDDNDTESISGMSSFSIGLSDNDKPTSKSKERLDLNDYIKGSGLASRVYLKYSVSSSDYMTPLNTSFDNKLL
ncbi:hypothetical protein BB561_006356 [Smittium simulii]|uniref:Kinesin motor domain-containing protein n=1 Tax=Smittium simulii TaxID=133385 RepID=A0A2T9Y4Y1_9FUNG|nr:hypothetical protein BB561_006356 [Smittium simulii]